jgi:hypothetical protein
MDTYLGSLTVNAKPMTRQEYNNFRGWTLPDDEDGNDAGYLVEDLVTDHINWQPKAVFNELFHNSGNMTFSDALEIVKRGGRVSRSGWNGKNMFIFLVQGSTFTVNREPLISILGEGTEVNYHGHVDMRTADGTIVPWLCSQTDMLANDWGVVPDA